MIIYWNYCRPHIFLARPTVVVGLHHPDTASLHGRNRVKDANRFAIKPRSVIDVVINFLTQIKACFDCGVFAPNMLLTLTMLGLERKRYASPVLLYCTHEMYSSP